MTTTTTTDLPGIDLEETSEVRCRARPCEQPATWVMVLRCCITRPTYVCDKHALKLRSALKGLTPRPILCAYCRQTPALTYEERLT